MVINREQRWVYVGPPKTASTTLHACLQGSPFFGTVVDTVSQHDAEEPDDVNGFKVLFSIRNPYARAVSLWRHYTCERGLISFREFLRWISTPTYDNAFFSDTLTSYLRDWMLGRRYLLRQESLSSDIELALQVPCPPLLMLNTTEHADWRVYYKDDPVAARLVEASFRSDFNFFGYPVFLTST